jgi:hypothetical protein
MWCRLSPITPIDTVWEQLRCFLNQCSIATNSNTLSRIKKKTSTKIRRGKYKLFLFKLDSFSTLKLKEHGSSFLKHLKLFGYRILGHTHSSNLPYLKLLNVDFVSSDSTTHFDSCLDNWSSSVISHMYVDNDGKDICCWLRSCGDSNGGLCSTFSCAADIFLTSLPPTLWKTKNILWFVCFSESTSLELRL